MKQRRHIVAVSDNSSTRSKPLNFGLELTEPGARVGIEIDQRRDRKFLTLRGGAQPALKRRPHLAFRNRFGGGHAMCGANFLQDRIEGSRTSGDLQRVS